MFYEQVLPFTNHGPLSAMANRLDSERSGTMLNGKTATLSNLVTGAAQLNSSTPAK